MLCRGWLFLECFVGRARLTGGLFSARVPRRPAARLLLYLATKSPPPRRATHGVPADNIRFWGRMFFLKRSLASTGHRGRVDARGHRTSRAPGLTRTSNRSACVPSREGRCRAPSARAWARDAKRRAIVSLDKEGWACRPVVRVKPAALPMRWPRASTRPRWPVDAKAPLKTTVSSLNSPRCWRGRVGWGLDRRLALRSTALTTACPWQSRARPAGAARSHQSTGPERNTAVSPRRAGEPSPSPACRTVKPWPARSGSRGHRRGLDGPSMPKPL